MQPDPSPDVDNVAEALSRSSLSEESTSSREVSRLIGVLRRHAHHIKQTFHLSGSKQKESGFKVNVKRKKFRRDRPAISPKVTKHNHNSSALFKIEDVELLSARNPASIASSSTPSSRRKKWTKEEDQLLRMAVERFGAKNWKSISEEVGHGKTHIQCLQRWKQVLQPGLIKGSWTKEEDEQLIALMQHFGDKNERNSKRFTDWKQIEKYMGGRTAKQARERWLLNLNPEINKTDWTVEEDDELMRLQEEFGNAWSRIKTLLNNNRTENAVKLRFNYLNKQRTKLWTVDEDCTVILGKKYRSVRYENICTDLPGRSKHAVQKRWRYLCSIDDSLASAPLHPVDEDDMPKLAYADAQRVFSHAARITPEKVFGESMSNLSATEQSSITTNTSPHKHESLFPHYRINQSNEFNCGYGNPQVSQFNNYPACYMPQANGMPFVPGAVGNNSEKDPYYKSNSLEMWRQALAQQQQQYQPSQQVGGMDPYNRMNSLRSLSSLKETEFDEALKILTKMRSSDGANHQNNRLNSSPTTGLDLDELLMNLGS